MKNPRTPKKTVILHQAKPGDGPAPVPVLVDPELAKQIAGYDTAALMAMAALLARWAEQCLALVRSQVSVFDSADWSENDPKRVPFARDQRN